MRLEELLIKEQIKIDVKNSIEYKIIKDNSFKYKNILKLYNLNTKSTFHIILVSIVMKALNNKYLIEKETSKYIEESIKNKNFIDNDYINEKIHKYILDNNLPSFKIDEKEVFVPIFSLSINNLYSSNQYKLFEKPNDNLLTKYIPYLIDLFEEYNFSLYDSTFTRLVKIDSNNNVTAFYHVDFKCLYFVNSQGRLDYQIPLFDKYLPKPHFNHVVTRLIEVVKAYFDNDKNLFLNLLIKNELLSSKIIDIYNKKNKKIV